MKKALLVFLFFVSLQVFSQQITFNKIYNPYNKNDIFSYGAGVAETGKSISEFRLLDAFRQTFEIFGSGIVPSLPPYGDRIPDFFWKTIGMIDADKNKK